MIESDEEAITESLRAKLQHREHELDEVKGNIEERNILIEKLEEKIVSIDLKIEE
jgi:hypothetical protein